MSDRYVIFVDGSNLFGVGKHLQLEFDDYEKLFRYIFIKCVDDRNFSFLKPDSNDGQLVRVYWYVVGSIDDWDLSNPKAQVHLQRLFDSDREIRPIWMKAAVQSLREAGKSVTQQTIADEAWALCFR